jgi:hypothetical protein
MAAQVLTDFQVQVVRKVWQERQVRQVVVQVVHKAQSEQQVLQVVVQLVRKVPQE